MARSLPHHAVLWSLVFTFGCGGKEAGGDTQRQPASSTPATADSLTSRADAGRIQGNPNAPVWIVEISDFQCPFCKTWHDEVYATLRREYIVPGTVRLAYINYPLPNHANALPAAEAAMCAGAQNKFWEMHDGLFDAQETWGPMPNAAAVFDSIARAKGVDVAAMRRCIETGAARALILADAERAQESGVQGTPSFVIGGDVMLRGMQPIEAFRRAIDEKMAARSRATP
jgi:protein-disulfide isomerase